MQPSVSLFRQEVAASRSERMFGNVAVVVPISWQATGLLLFSAVVAAIGFAATATYARVATVTGAIVPVAGVAPIVPQRTGVITSIQVSDGQDVRAGQPVAFIRIEEEAVRGDSIGQRIEQALVRQDTTVLAQLRASASSAAAGQQQFSAQRAGLEAEIAQIGAQIASQQLLIANARRAYDQAQLIAERGFISQRDLEARQDAVVGREQAMAQLSQMLAAKRSQLAETKRTAEQSRFQSGAQIAALESSRAQIAQQAAAARGNRAYAIVAPVSGRITALTARVGQPATTQVPLMTVVPASSRLRAELAVPSAAIGFVKPRQDVRLAIDAFPFQRFGTVRGHVSTVASSPVAQPGAGGVTVPLYPVLVELEATSVTAYGHKEPLVPGMTISARIVTQRQSLLRWLFDPLFAVSRR